MEPIAASTPVQNKSIKIIEELLRTPTVQPFVSLDTLRKAEIERARRMRPLTPEGLVAAPPGPETEAVVQPEVGAAETKGPEAEADPETIAEGDDDLVAASQSPAKGDGATAAGGGHQELVSRAEGQPGAGGDD